MSVSKILGSYVVNEGVSVYISGWVEDVSLNMLIDTGSAVTLIHERLLDKVDRGKQLSKGRERVVLANGQPRMS